MPRRKSLSDLGVAALKPRESRYAEPDPELRGHYVRVHPSGAKSFVAVARDPKGKQVWATIGAADHLTIAEARDMAREAVRRIRSGLSAVEAPATKPDAFAAVAANWLKRHVEANGLRTRRDIERLLASHVLPVWADRDFLSIRRSDVAALLDDVEDGHGARQADCVLTIIRSLMSWVALRHDDYTPPIVRGMARQDQRAQARKRILDDSEIRAIWLAADASGTYGAILKTLLLTGQRRIKVGTMRWEELSAEGEWTLPREPREKDNAGSLVLPPAALDIIRSQPRIASNPFVFAGRGTVPFSTWSAAKANFDAKLPSDMPGWVVHDLRRTARSLLSRAGVRPDIAERVLGHAIAGVEGVYDRHSYALEKADALRHLAALVETIVNPPAANVVPLRGKGR